MIDRRRLLMFVPALILVNAASIYLATASEVAVNAPIRLQSAYPFAETVQKLRSALEGKGLTVFAEIDQKQAAQTVGLDMPPTTLLIYGNPKGGTPLMLASPDFALELPLKLLVREEDGNKVLVVFTPASLLDGRFGLPKGLARTLAGVEPTIASSIDSPSHQSP